MMKITYDDVKKYDGKVTILYSDDENLKIVGILKHKTRSRPKSLYNNFNEEIISILRSDSLYVLDDEEIINYIHYLI